MDVPSGTEIASWFRGEHAGRLHAFQGYDGLELVRDGADYCYVWLEAYVDMDLVGFFLLDVRTRVGGVETRDFLLVADGAERFCEWWQHPVATDAAPQVHRDRFRLGLCWMAERIDRSFDDLAGAPGSAPVAGQEVPGEVVLD